MSAFLWFSVSRSFLWRFLFLVSLAFAFPQAFPWYLSLLQTSVSAVSLSLRCFLFPLRLLYSVHSSLFLHWPLFVYAIASSVSGCFKVLLLRSVTRSDLRFSLNDEVACWDESLLFLCAPSSSTPVVLSSFSRLFPVFPPCLCIRNFLSSVLFLPGFVPSSLLVGVVPSIFSAFFFSFCLPYLFVAFTSSVLFCSSVPP